ncbi:phage minor tail protein L [Sulfuritortus calidifontis]|uniref:phage minor tail protein L n=1 Tax=Sulfuritortus calidifontis TaxID=1914471 RepID=UPI000F81B085|nr:phage minor tail protein L [Sulfuritortus calidifontis]
MSIQADIQQAQLPAIVELYELDTTVVGGMDVLRFTPHGPNELGGDIVFGGLTYTSLPIEASGFARSGQGALPRPKLAVANVSGLVGAVADDLIGAKLIRERTFIKYLDAVNFAGGNPQADPNQVIDREIWFVDRKATENKLLVEFELAAAFDLAGVMLPRRQFVQNVCPWRYRGPECCYTGGPVADEKDQPTADPAKDRCGKRLASCKLRFGPYAELPFGGFPAVGLLR